MRVRLERLVTRSRAMSLPRVQRVGGDLTFQVLCLRLDRAGPPVDLLWREPLGVGRKQSGQAAETRSKGGTLTRVKETGNEGGKEQEEEG